MGVASRVCEGPVRERHVHLPGLELAREMIAERAGRQLFDGRQRDVLGGVAGQGELGRGIQDRGAVQRAAAAGPELDVEIAPLVQRLDRGRFSGRGRGERRGRPLHHQRLRLRDVDGAGRIGEAAAGEGHRHRPRCELPGERIAEGLPVAAGLHDVFDRNARRSGAGQRELGAGIGDRRGVQAGAARRGEQDLQVAPVVQLGHVLEVFQQVGRGTGNRKRLAGRDALVPLHVLAAVGQELHLHRPQTELAGERVAIGVFVLVRLDRIEQRHAQHARSDQRDFGGVIDDRGGIQRAARHRPEADGQVTAGVQGRPVDLAPILRAGQMRGGHGYLERFGLGGIRPSLAVGEAVRQEFDLVFARHQIHAGWQGVAELVRRGEARGLRGHTRHRDAGAIGQPQFEFGGIVQDAGRVERGVAFGQIGHIQVAAAFERRQSDLAARAG